MLSHFLKLKAGLIRVFVDTLAHPRHAEELHANITYSYIWFHGSTSHYYMAIRSAVHKELE